MTTHVTQNRSSMGLNRRVAELLSRVVDLFCTPWLSRWVGESNIRYFVCGAMNYIALDATLYYLIYHYVVAERFIVLGEWLTISPHVASLIVVFPITFLTGFWLNRYVAFRATEMAAGWQLVRYALSVVGSIVLSYLALKLFVEVAGIWATPAKVLSSITTAVYSLLMARLFTFRKG